MIFLIFSIEKLNFDMVKRSEIKETNSRNTCINALLEDNSLEHILQYNCINSLKFIYWDYKEFQDLVQSFIIF